MLMEMWVVLKSLSQSNCHNVTMTFINSYNDRIECSKVDVVIPVSACVMTPQSMMRLPSRRCCSFRVLSKLCPSMSLFLSLSPPPVPLVPFTTFTQSQTRTHTHTNSRRASRWMTARSLPAKSGLKGTAIHQRCVFVCGQVCVDPSQCWASY